MPKKQSAPAILPILIILAVIGGGLYFLFKPQPETVVRQAPSFDQNQTIERKKTPQRAQRPVEQDTPADTTPSDETGTLRQAPMVATLKDPCREQTAKLDEFFSYLDEQEYVESYQFPEGSKKMISTLVNDLLASPPSLNSSRFNGVDTARNAAHIYRVVGGQNIFFLLKIIDNERDLLEEVAADFYQWFKISDQCRGHSYPLRPNLAELYEYASFFLHSAGGQAYLARREPSLALLCRFYSIVIIHQAEKNGLNSHRIDLSPYLFAITNEMKETEDLAMKQRYLTTLHAIIGSESISSPSF